MPDAQPDPRTVEDLIELGYLATVRAFRRSKDCHNEQARRAIDASADWLREQARRMRQEPHS